MKRKLWFYVIIGALFFCICFAYCTKQKSSDITTVTDIDGNDYNIVTIGSQVWMAENLKVTKYNDNTTIPLITDNSTWTTLTTSAYCWYNNDLVNKSKYGALYNWFAVASVSNGGKNICPKGWHIPTDAQWTILTNYLTKNGYGYAGNESLLAKSMAATSGWDNPGIYGTADNIGIDQAINNSSGFTALPGGYRFIDGGYYNYLDYGLWWSTTESSSAKAWNLTMYYNDGRVYRNDLVKNWGCSVRCLHD
jgi:uncharacterized protein (TIGR02145 family)